MIQKVDVESSCQWLPVTMLVELPFLSIRQIITKEDANKTSKLCQVLSCLLLTSVDDLPAYSQHNLTITGSVGHQIQHLLVRTTFNHHTIDANELIPCPQTTILLCSSTGHNGPNVHLGKDILIEG